jgi:phage/plasmid-like protein (TIGR03299 family)
MAHEVETMAYAHETPWHGLGRRVTPDMTDQEMLVAAGLDWRVDKHDLIVEAGGERQVIKGRKALIRSTDNRFMDVVGDDWNPIQNADAMKFFRSFVEAGEATMETAGSLRGGKMVWGLARLGTDFTLPGGDRVNGYLLLGSPHEHGKAGIGRVTPVRVVCANTFAAAMIGGAKFEARFNHRYSFDPEKAREAMGLARDGMSQFEKNAKMLMSLNMTREDAVRILAPVYQPDLVGETPSSGELPELVDGGELGPRMTKIMTAYEKAPGATPGTGWGVFNAVTYFGDHVAGKANDRDARLASAWTGTEARRKNVVFQRLLELAA